MYKYKFLSTYLNVILIFIHNISHFSYKSEIQNSKLTLFVRLGDLCHYIDFVQLESKLVNVQCDI